MTASALVFGLFGLAALFVPQPSRITRADEQARQTAESPMTADALVESLTRTGWATVTSLTFEPGAAAPTQASRAAVAAIADVLKDRPEWRLAIRAYAGEPGPPASATLPLARARAAAVRTALIQTYAIAPDRLVAEAYPEVIGGRDSSQAPPNSPRIELVRITARTSAPPAPAGTSGEWTGQIASGQMAVGGETTGITLAVGQERFELRAADRELRARLQQLNGKTATIRGTLETRRGIEVGTRRIITVTEIIEAPGSPSRSEPRPSGR